MAQAIKVDSQFATVRDTARTLGVSRSRTDQLINRARKLTSRIIIRNSSAGEFAAGGQVKRKSAATDAGTKTYKTKSKAVKTNTNGYKIPLIKFHS